MKNSLDKYTYRVEWSEEDGVHIASVLEFPSLKAHGKTPEQALQQIRKVVRETIAWMREDHEEIPEPFGLRQFKGNLTLRTSPSIHRELVMQAALHGVSVNHYIVQKAVSSVF